MATSEDLPGKIPQCPPGMSQETWLDVVIREAQARGAFDNLPKIPIPGAGEDYQPDWWIQQKLKEEQIVFAPEPLRLRREAEAMLETIPAQPSENAVRQLVVKINDCVRRANALPLPEAIKPLPLLQEADAIQRWRANHKK